MADAPRPNTLLGQGIQSAARSFTRLLSIGAKVVGTAIGLVGGVVAGGIAVAAGLALPFLAVGAVAGAGAGYLYARHQAKQVSAVIEGGAAVVGSAVDDAVAAAEPAAPAVEEQASGVDL